MRVLLFSFLVLSSFQTLSAEEITRRLFIESGICAVAFQTSHRASIKLPEGEERLGLHVYARAVARESVNLNLIPESQQENLFEQVSQALWENVVEEARRQPRAESFVIKPWISFEFGEGGARELRPIFKVTFDGFHLNPENPEERLIHAIEFIGIR